MNDTRSTQLEQIAEGVWNLEESPLYSFRQANNYSMVMGEGNPCANLMFIGEAPGKKEAESGRPFVGAAGKILDELLQSINLNRAEVYITNIVKDRPPNNRDPTPTEIELYKPFLIRQIEVIQPKVVATLGRFAMEFMLDHFNLAQNGQKISALHGKVLPASTSYGQISVVPLYHPAVVLYRRSRREAVENDFKVLKEIL